MSALDLSAILFIVLLPLIAYDMRNYYFIPADPDHTELMKRIKPNYKPRWAFFDEMFLLCVIVPTLFYSFGLGFSFARVLP